MVRGFDSEGFRDGTTESLKRSRKLFVRVVKVLVVHGVELPGYL